MLFYGYSQNSKWVICQKLFLWVNPVRNFYILTHRPKRLLTLLLPFRLLPHPLLLSFHFGVHSIGYFSSPPCTHTPFECGPLFGLINTVSFARMFGFACIRSTAACSMVTLGVCDSANGNQRQTLLVGSLWRKGHVTTFHLVGSPRNLIAPNPLNRS